MSFEDMVDFPLEFLAGSFENKILITIPTCELFIFSHFLLLFVIRFVLEAGKFGHQIAVEADNSKECISERLFFRNNIFFG